METTQEKPEIDPVEEKQLIEERKANFRKCLHNAVDEMADLLETLDIDPYIQLHMFSNDFPSKGIILHDTYCEINIETLSTSDVKHQMGFDQLVKRSKTVYPLDLKLGDLIINSERRIDPNSKVIDKVEKELELIDRDELHIENIRIQERDGITTPRLSSTDHMLYVPPQYSLSMNESSSILQSCERFYNRTTASHLDNLISSHNASIHIQRIEEEARIADHVYSQEDTNRPITVVSAHPNEDHNIQNDYLRLNSHREITETETSDLISEAEALGFDIESIRRFIVEHNEQYYRTEETITTVESVPVSNISAHGISVLNGRIHPSDTNYIPRMTVDALLTQASNINETTLNLVRQIIREHNHQSMIDIVENAGSNQPGSVYSTERDEPGDVAQSIVRSTSTDDETPQPTNSISAFGVSIINGRVHPETTGYITNPTFSRLCDIALTINEATERRVYRILNNHNSIVSQPGDVAEGDTEQLREVFEMRSTGFSDENIRHHVESQSGDITIEEEDDGVGEETTDRRPN